MRSWSCWDYRFLGSKLRSRLSVTSWMLLSCLYLFVVRMLRSWRDSLTLAVIFMSLHVVSQKSIDVWIGPGESWSHWFMEGGAVSTCAGGWKSESSGPWWFYSCSTDVRLGLCPGIWDGDLTPSVPGLFRESLSIADQTSCPTSSWWERHRWDLLPVLSVSVSCGCMDMWLVFLMLILLTRFS